MNHDDTLDQLKDRLEEKLDKAKCMIYLVHQGKMIREDKLTLDNHKIGPGAVLHMIEQEIPEDEEKN